MKHLYIPFVFLSIVIGLAGCVNSETKTNTGDPVSAGLIVTDSGLGDDSFSDSAFQGLEQARDELGITFDYREPFDQDYEKHARNLLEQDHDVIIGLGYNSQVAIEKLAKEYPEQSFVMIDAISELENVTSITFKEDEGSYLIGLIAGMKTETNTVGFIGGEEIPVVERFEEGFKEGVKEANPEAHVLSEYSGTFDDDDQGASITKAMVEENADFVFPAAGFTGIGVLKEAQRQGIHAFGVDSDQFFVAEEAVVSSMLKNVNVALYNVMKQLDEGEKLDGGAQSLGIDEDGVGLAPIRLIEWTSEEQELLNDATGQ
ncbi:nucleoside-binding protein [Halobacillus karajensis]|uniref:Purine nucleoside receptor A n=1 Tax=Halobacillus karajensis TaxID=195088 RepID=A0A024P8J7_9BACI|nr:Purine nucleoside receptor A [Halobacillus karajensis]CDQ25459.1 Purine nucleoside receptor A [Halobacillus karajensis]CDQ29010.1 Purine nucleoside receptor A [Halobacillus karajensis]SEI09276.1 nucleoside-binding protein [Halobacillus karajensis]